MKTTVLLFAFLFVISCYVFGADLKVNINKYPTTTVGNHTYIDISKYGRPDENKNRDEILNILSEFEKTNPNKEITGWKIEKQQRAYTVLNNYLYDLWIDHRPKQKKQYFFCLCAQTSEGGVSYTNGTIDVEEGEDIQKTLDKIKAYGAKRYECNEDKVVVTAFNKIE